MQQRKKYKRVLLSNQEHPVQPLYVGFHKTAYKKSIFNRVIENLISS